MGIIRDVVDYGMEVLKKAALIPDDTNKTRYAIRTVPMSESGQPIEVDNEGQVHIVGKAKECACNSSTTALGAGEIFTGGAQDISGYNGISIFATSDKESATKGLEVQFSWDEVNWHTAESYTVLANAEKFYTPPAFGIYFRVKYTNGATTQGLFELRTTLRKMPFKWSSHNIEDAIKDQDDAELVKAVITGKKANGDYDNVSLTNGGNAKVSVEELESGISSNNNSQLNVTPFDSSGNELGTVTNPTKVDLPSSSYDDFGKIGVAEPFKLIEYSANYPIDTTRYHDTDLTGSATIVQNTTTTQIELKTTTASGDKAIFSTRRNIQYNKGNAQEILVIYRPNPLANRRERWGYFDTNNGVFFEHDGTNARVVIKSNTSGSIVDTKVEQASWDDPLDGTGTSGLTIDFTKQTVFKITFGWLSSRGVRFFADIGGTIVNFHTYYISNSLTVPFMATANLPVRFEVENTDTTAQTQTSSFTCFAVQSSGSDVQEGAVRLLDTGLTAVTATTTEQIFAGIRLNSSYLNASLQPLKYKLIPTGGNTFVRYRVIYNPTLTSPTWSAGESGVFDYLSGTMPTFSGGSTVAVGHISLGNKNQVADQTLQDLLSDIYVGRGIDNSQDALVLTLETNSSTGTVLFSQEFKEYV